MYVHGKGVSRFVSYADFPPILGVAPPTGKDFSFWRRRWKKRQQADQKKQAPAFWAQFFAYQFRQAPSLPALCKWGELLGLVKFAFSEATIQVLQQSFKEDKWVLENF